MNNKTLIWAIVFIVVIVLGSVFFIKNPSPANNEDNISTEKASSTVPVVKEFNITSSHFRFSSEKITVNKGDTVKINFKNEEGFHDWVIDEFGAKTNQLKAGQSQTIEFVADKAGQFEYYCSVGNHRAMGMVGKLIVQ